MPNELRDSDDRPRFSDWVTPTSLPFDVADLHWKKASPDTLDRSHDALARLRPHLPHPDTILGDEGAWRSEREKLRVLDGPDGPLFSDQDLRFYDLYFGPEHIRVGHGYGRTTVDGGRHRLSRAFARGVPVPVEFTSDPNAMSWFESSDTRDAADLDKEIDEQEEAIEELDQKVQEAEEAIERVEVVAEKVGDLQGNLDSEHLRRRCR